MRKSLVYCFVAVFSGALCGYGLAQDDRPDLTGTWQLDASKSDIKLSKFSDLKMTIAEKGDRINISDYETLGGGKERTIVYDCTTDGKECIVKSTGAKASFWYNGPMLVNMETEKKGDVFRYRMKLSSDAKELTIEVSCLVPQNDKVDKLVLAKR
jgi:hypothetical protein